MRARPTVPLLLLALLGFAGACTEASEEDPAAPPGAVQLDEHVLASTPFLEDWARVLLEDDVPVEGLLPDGTEPESFSPDREQLAAIQRARRVLIHGAGLEPWAQRVALPGSRVVIVTEGLEDRFLHHATITHSHGGGEKHTHADVDAMLWVDPALAALEIERLGEALASAFSAHRTEILARTKTLVRRYGAAAERVAAIGAEAAKHRFVASHRSWSYLAAAAGVPLEEQDLDASRALGEAERDALLALLPADGSGPIVLSETEPGPSFTASLPAGVRALWFPTGRQRVRSADGVAVPQITLLENALDRWQALLEASAR